MKRISAICVVIFFLGGAVSSLIAAPIDKIVAIVNNEVITDAELNAYIMLSDFERDPSLASQSPSELKRRLLDRMIEDRLILQEAKRREMLANPSLVEDRILEIKKRAGSELAFEMALKTQGFTLSELRKKFSNQLLIYALIQQEVQSKVNVRPKEVNEFFDKHQESFMTPETAVVNSIFVRNRNDLEEVQTRLQDGGDFSELAKEYSQKSNIGMVSRGQLREELEDFIFNLGVNQCSRPFEFDDGYYIFLTKKKMAPQEISIHEVKESIKKRIENEKMDRALKGWLMDLKDRAYISVRGV